MIKSLLSSLIKKQQDLDEEILAYFNDYWKSQLKGYQSVSIFKEVEQRLRAECGNVQLPEEIITQLRILKHDARLAEQKRHQDRVYNARECLPEEIKVGDDGWLSVN